MSNNILSDKHIRVIEFFLEYSNHLALFIAYVIILVGIIEGVVFLIKNIINNKLDVNILDKRTNNIIETRIKILNSINLGIVFIIAGDVIKTIYIPDLYNLIKVVALIGVREILSYFTNSEIEQLKKLKEDTILQNPNNEMS